MTMVLEKDKFYNDLSIDKENDNVIYNDQQHVYIDKTDGSYYISVTTLIHNYTNIFDSAFWSAYKALESLTDDVTFAALKKVLLTTKKFDPSILHKLSIDESQFNTKREEILQSYEDGKNKSCERGTKIHAEFENSMYQNPEKELKRYGLGGKFSVKKGHYRLDTEKAVYPEFLISVKSRDGVLRVAGQIDLLIKDGNDIIIIDFKTNKKIDRKSYYNKSTKRYECLKYPLNTIQDCNLMHYTLQLSMYAYLLQQINPDLNIKMLKLIHIDHSNKVEEIEVEYMKKEVEVLLKHYKKQLLIKEELSKDTPIVY